MGERGQREPTLFFRRVVPEAVRDERVRELVHGQRKEHRDQVENEGFSRIRKPAVHGAETT